MLFGRGSKRATEIVGGAAVESAVPRDGGATTCGVVGDWGKI